jgi:hypothetical protein
MADLGTMTSEPEKTGTQEATGRPGRRIRRARSLPGGRAVVGALLITAAAVGVFAAFLTATAEPTTHYAVARDDIEVGTRIDSDAAVAELFEFVPVDLPHDVSVRAVRDVQAPSWWAARHLARSPAATCCSPRRSSTTTGCRPPRSCRSRCRPPMPSAVPCRRVSASTSWPPTAAARTPGPPSSCAACCWSPSTVATPAMAASSDVTLTVAVSSLEDVQALGHAVRSADVFVTRSTVTEGSTEPAPGAFTPSREQTPPRPDPAGDPLGPGAPQPTPTRRDEEADDVDDAPDDGDDGDEDEDD